MTTASDLKRLAADHDAVGALAVEGHALDVGVEAHVDAHPRGEAGHRLGDGARIRRPGVDPVLVLEERQDS